MQNAPVITLLYHPDSGVHWFYNDLAGIPLEKTGESKMKLTLALVLSGTCLISLSGIAQNNGGTSTGAGGSAGVGAAGQASGAASTHAGAQQQLPGKPGLSGATGADVGNADANQSQGGQNPQNNQAAATNGAPGFPTPPAPNEGGFNNTNMRPLSATSRPGATNSIFATNSFGATNGADALQRDQAITAADQAMLAQMRQTVFPPGQPMAPWMNSIHFILKDGAVRLVGTVASLQERQQIEATVRQVPGVVRVYDALAVNASAGAAAGPANANASANGNAPVPPTPTPTPSADLSTTNTATGATAPK